MTTTKTPQKFNRGDRKGENCIFDHGSRSGNDDLCWVKPVADRNVTWLVHRDELLPLEQDSET